MADVTIPVVGDGPRTEPQNRAQMLLVAAFGVAVMLVALALILNTSIYTENIATRGSDIGGGQEVVRYQSTTQSSVAGTIEYANYNNNTTQSEVAANVTAGVQTYDNISSRQQATSGVVTNTSVEEVHDGTRVYQNRDRNFTNDTGTEDWIIANDVEDLRAFRLNVSESSLNATVASDFGVDDEFFILFEDATGDQYFVSIYENATTGDISLTVRDPSGSLSSCHVTPGSRVNIDLTAATVEGETCDPLKFFDDLSTPYEVSYNDTENLLGPTIVGRYTFTVNQSVTTFEGNLPEDHYSNDTEVPEVTPAVYSTTVHLLYESNRVYYETDLRVAPGEPDD